ncbi:hypothetical protein KFK09_028612 [Dendrobium nobile]|nr:hypothetical protein KFK09_028612 [Dendrobium nobile]
MEQEGFRLEFFAKMSEAEREMRGAGLFANGRDEGSRRAVPFLRTAEEMGVVRAYTRGDGMGGSSSRELVRE